MKSQFTMTLSLLAGVAIGAIAVQGLHAQAGPPVYVVSEIDVTNVNSYAREYAPLAQASIRNAGGKRVALSQNVIPLEGTPTSQRVTINAFDSIEKAQAWRDSAEYKEARKIGDKYAKFRAYVVDGVPQ